MDASIVPALVAAASTVLTIAYTKSQANQKSQRRELRFRRKLQGLQNLREFDLIDQVTKLGAEPVAERSEYIVALKEKEEEEW